MGRSPWHFGSGWSVEQVSWTCICVLMFDTTVARLFGNDTRLMCTRTRECID